MKTLATESDSSVGAILVIRWVLSCREGSASTRFVGLLGASKRVSVRKLLARWVLGCVSECCLLLLSYQWY